MEFLTKNTLRALRRHHIARLKKNRKNYWGYGSSYGSEKISIMSIRQLGRVIQYPQACSCFMCCNSRKTDGRTRKELLHIFDYIAWVKYGD